MAVAPDAASGSRRRRLRHGGRWLVVLVACLAAVWARRWVPLGPRPCARGTAGAAIDLVRWAIAVERAEYVDTALLGL